MSEGKIHRPQQPGPNLDGRNMIVAARIGTQRCGNCKHQGAIEPEFVDPNTQTPLKMCLESPCTISCVFTFVMGPQGITGQIQKIPSYPPAPDHWTCGRWKPRFAAP